MECPKCDRTMRQIQYEGIAIETCESCYGEWLDGDELFKITELREKRFDPETRRAITESTTITATKPARADRNLECPGCGWDMEPRSYGGASGMMIDKCTGCGGFWLDDVELEKVQMLVEGWDDCLSDDLRMYGDRLRNIEAAVDARDDVTVSRLPVLGRFINAAVNGILDLS